MNWTQIGAIAGPIVGIAALALGIVNYRLHRKMQQVRVTVKLAGFNDQFPHAPLTEGTLFVECGVLVSNDSNFEVAIAEVGIQVQNPEPTTLKPVKPTSTEGTPLPCRLAPRRSCLIPLGTSGYALASRHVKTVYAKLDSGKIFHIAAKELTILNLIGKTIREVSANGKTELLDRATQESKAS